MHGGVLLLDFGGYVVFWVLVLVGACRVFESLFGDIMMRLFVGCGGMVW